MRVRLYKKTKDNLSYFQFLSDDGQAVLNSQGYADKDDRNNGVRSVVANADNAARYERKISDEGKNYFILKAGNGQEIARSVDFDDAAAMDAAITACVAEIPSITADESEGQPREAAAAPAAATDNNPYDDGRGGDDNYRPLSFYQERIKGVENGFDSFATDNGQFYFTLNQGGKIVLISEAYTSADGRNNGTASVTRNLPNPDRYQPMQHPNGKYYFNLLAGNNQQIATSTWFDSAADRDAAIAGLQRGLFGGTEEVVLKEAGSGVTSGIEGMANYRATVRVADAPPPKEKAPKEKKKRKPKEHKEKSADEKVFLKSGNYLFNGVTWQTMRSANHKHYFSFRTADGKSLMLSSNVQGFATEAEVDAQVQKVMELGPYEGNYAGKTTANNKYYFYLNNTDGKPVAKSFFYDTTADMNDAIGLLIGRTRVAAAAAPAAIATAESVHDDYLACERYNGSAAFHRFFNGDDENWYFGYNDAEGKALLRSEGYTTEKARDNGIESVMKNAPLEERWVTGMDGDQYYYALRAGNNQEIARSCYFADEESMNAGLTAAKDAFAPKVEKAAEAPAAVIDDYLPCEAYAGMEGYHKFEHEGEYYFSYNDIAGNVILRSEGYKSEAARDNGIESVKKNSPIENHWIKKQHEDGRWYFSLIAGNRQEIARTCYHEEDALFGILRSAVGPLYTPPPPPKAPEPAPRIVDDYLPCEAYTGGEGYHKFEHEGEYYFSYNDANGNVILRSEGYKSAGARDNGIESVKKNSPIENHWIKKQHEDGRWYFSLIAGNKQEIARTCYHEEAALFGILRSAVGPLYTPPPPPRAPEPVAAPAPVIVDDYLPCEAYAGKADDDGFRRFMHEGEYYFAYLDNDGEVVLRSEGYKSAGARDNGVASVKKNAPIEERWVKEKSDDGRHYWSLKAANKQEIARSCYKDALGAAGWGLFAAAAAPIAAAVAAAAPIVAAPAPIVEKPRVAAPPPPPPPPPAPVAGPVVAETSSGSSWWKWLLPLLLLALLFLLWKGCDGCKKPTPPLPPVEEPTTQTPPADTVKEEPAPPAAPVCACKGSSNSIFNIPEGATPKQLQRLGTNPEFRNSHSLDGKGFFDKLTRHYSRSQVDKAFLDDLFKAMGYANGFADAKPEMFSEVTLPVGTTGNMGYSTAHKTLYATVPENEKDRMAFRIESANGCHMHFMKTCGNHFFFCPN